MTKGRHVYQPAHTGPVYIIDDDQSVRIALERLLVSAGFRVRTFVDAQNFLQSGAPIKQACIVADVRMQGMSGLDLSRKLKAEGADTAFIFVTADDSPEVRREAQESGVTAYFRKPVDDQALIDAINWAINSRRQE